MSDAQSQARTDEAELRRRASSLEVKVWDNIPSPIDQSKPRPRMVHTLKQWVSFFEAITSGVKTWEIRAFDRDYRVGDHLYFMEWVRFSADSGHYTGRRLRMTVPYIGYPTENQFIPPGRVIMSLAFIQGWSGPKFFANDAPIPNFSNEEEKLP